MCTNAENISRIVLHQETQGVNGTVPEAVGPRVYFNGKSFVAATWFTDSDNKATETAYGATLEEALQKLADQLEPKPCKIGDIIALEYKDLYLTPLIGKVTEIGERQQGGNYRIVVDVLASGIQESGEPLLRQGTSATCTAYTSLKVLK